MPFEIEHFTHAAPDGFRLACARIALPDPKGCVLVVHGAKEHKERYYPFMRELAEAGWASMAFDLRGHGASVGGDYPLGHWDSPDALVGDTVHLTAEARSLAGGGRLALLGHSLGSMLARMYLREHDTLIDRLVLSGRAAYLAPAPAGVRLASLICRVHGERGYSSLLKQVVEGKDVSWVNSDEDELERYRSDPLCCGYRYTCAAVRALVEANAEMKRLDRWRCANPGLPILSVTGALDRRVALGEKGVADACDDLRRVGYRSVRSIVYPGLKHELLVGRQRAQVMPDVLSFLEEGGGA